MEYKHLTKEMKKTLNVEIKEIGKNALYDRVERSILLNEVIEEQNKPGAFDMSSDGKTPNWYNEMKKPKIIEFKNLSLEEEILYYINPKRFKQMGYE